jgi:probable HAF family extracellular repeat protein
VGQIYNTNVPPLTPIFVEACLLSANSINWATSTFLGTLGGYSYRGQGLPPDISCAYAINNSGQVVGGSFLSDNVTYHAFLYYRNGPMLDLNNLLLNSIGTYLTEAFGINDSGQIIANGANGHAYLLTPTPPAPWLVQPNFLSITQTGGTVNFTWSTAVGPTYQVQYNSDLTSTNWNNLGSPSIATNYTMSASDSITDLQRFYRVLMQ